MSSPLSSASAEVVKLARDLHKMGPATRRELRSTFDRVASPLLADARRRAGWSSRIPGAISVRPITDMGRGRVGVELRVDTDAAPHARPFEDLSAQGNAGYFRHPVFGNLDAWVYQTPRPYIGPAVDAHLNDAQDAIGKALDKALTSAGWS